MKEIKRKTYKERLAAGNKLADLVMGYLNHRFDNVDLDSCSKQEDIYDGLDFYDQNSNDTFQCKVRTSKYGTDVIYEAIKFYPQDKGLLVPPYNVVEGRDAHGKSKYTVCMPISQDCLLFPTTENLKKEFRNALDEWDVGIAIIESNNGCKCPLIMKEDDFILNEWVKPARRAWNQHMTIFNSKKGHMLQFKIDEGKGTAPYCKILAYIPAEVFKNCGCVQFRENEKLSDPNTWLDSSGENLYDLIVS